VEYATGRPVQNDIPLGQILHSGIVRHSLSRIKFEAAPFMSKVKLTSSR